MIHISVRVFIPQDISSEGKEILVKNRIEVIIGRGNSKESLLEHIHQCDAIILRSARLDRKMLSLAKDLKIIVRHGIGLDNIDLDFCQENRIIVANDPISNSNAVVEHVVTLILSAVKNIVYYDKKVRENKFVEARSEIRNVELNGKTFGQIGFGRIGQKVAEIMKNGFGMDVCYFDPNINFDLSDLKRVNSLEELLGQSDIVNISVPLTSGTKHLINSQSLKHCKNGVTIINTSRGAVIKTEDLIEAIKNEKISTCGLDVFENEPIPENDKLLSLDEIVVSPHNAALTKEAMVKMGISAANRIIEYVNNESIKYTVI